MSPSKMFKHDTQNPPEPGRWVRCIAAKGERPQEWRGQFHVRDGTTRPVFFIVQRDGNLGEDRFAWNHTVCWEYLDGKQSAPVPAFAEAAEA